MDTHPPPCSVRASSSAASDASTVAAVPFSRPVTFMWVTTGTSPDFSPIASVSSMPAFELKFDSGVTRS